MVERTTIVTEAETPEAFMAERAHFWEAWTRFVTMAAGGIVVLLIALAVFLL